ncbi:hypothetical protein CYY_005947 [Polysphondylium violaceum]|uniref:G8 domain-containing protein n=1 Tax=Polysphondylium violaceum TaxID=133409 RepID=A0A8J4Q1N3_9MYCE|nr:hypothetical protein CYY_005947 [Polysphondylium violaceum]
MNFKNNLFLILILLTILNHVVKSEKYCPDQKEGLKKWSSPTTWPNGMVPKDNDNVTITSDMKVLLDCCSNRINNLTILAGGQLVFSSKHGPVSLTATYIYVFGKFEIGSESCKYAEKATITLTGTADRIPVSDPRMGIKFIGVFPPGEIEIHGHLSEPIPSWGKLIKNVSVNDTILSLNKDVSKWPLQSTIVVGSTDYDHHQSEEAIIVACPDCTKNQVKISKPLKYPHFGQFTQGIDQRAEVGLLSRNILFRGEMNANCTRSAEDCAFFDFDTLGGHIMMMKGFKSARIEGAEFKHMGQTFNIARYPIHFHMCGETDNPNFPMEYVPIRPYVKDNSIHHTFSRCLTIHGTSGILAKNNFAFDNMGHCYFLEDGSEQRNDIESNVGLLTKPSFILATDRSCEVCLHYDPVDFNGFETSCDTCNSVSTFWISNPNNNFINNVAGGSARNGFKFIFPTHVSGLSSNVTKYANVFPNRIPLGRFVGNVAHSNAFAGFNLDNALQLSHPCKDFPQQYLSLIPGTYKPRRDPHDEASEIEASVIQEFTSYKNRGYGAYARGGEIRFEFSKFADSAVGVRILATEGEIMPADYGSVQQINSCLFVAESENNGVSSGTVNQYNKRSIPGSFNQEAIGLEINDGPQSYNNCTFINFNSKSCGTCSNCGVAIAFRPNSKMYFGPRNKFEGTKFILSENIFKIPDVDANQQNSGFKNQIVSDVDGKITGIPNSQIVNDLPFFESPNCVVKKNLNALVCNAKERFVSLFVYDQDPSMNNIGVIFMRDDKPQYRHKLSAFKNDTYFPLLMSGKSYTMHFNNAPTPAHLQLQMANFNQNDSVIVGICYPTNNIAFDITKKITQIGKLYEEQKPVHLSTSIDDVKMSPDGTVAYHDKKSGLLYLKFIQTGPSSWNNYCSDNGCESIIINISGSGVYSNVSGFCKRWKI